MNPSWHAAAVNKAAVPLSSFHLPDVALELVTDSAACPDFEGKTKTKEAASLEAGNEQSEVRSCRFQPLATRA